jgi:uncharacterized delta-60 repeat protein
MRGTVRIAIGLCCVVALGGGGTAMARAGGRGLSSVVEAPLPTEAAAQQAGIFDFARGSGTTVYGALGGSGSNSGYFGAVAFTGGETPDPGFAEGGFTAPLKLPFSGFDNLAPQAEATAVAPDGTLVVAGFSEEGANGPAEFSPLVARYRADGSLDPSFSGDGILGKAPQARGGTEFHDVAVTRDGIILAAGGRDEESVGAAAPAGVLYAYRPNGKADSAFGKGGRVLFKGRHRSSYSTLRGVQVLPSGKILVVGYLDSNLLLARLDADGRVDRSFGGSDGEVTLNLQSHICCEDVALGLASGGRIVVAGMGGSFSQYRVFLARYSPTGKLDRSFGDKGIEAQVHPHRLGILLGMAVEPSGKVVTVGRTEITPANRVRSFAVFLNLANGRPDRGFGQDGLYVLKPKTEGIAHAALALPGGTLLGGSRLNPESGGPVPATSLLLARLFG